MRDMKRTFVAIAVVVLAASGWLIAQGGFPGPQPEFGPLSITPGHAITGQPTVLAITIRIDTPTLNPSSVYLQELDADGGLKSVVSRLEDKGQASDARAGNRVFTTVFTFDAAVAGVHRYRISASFKGLPSVQFSPTTTFDVWQAVEDERLGLPLAYPSTWHLATETSDGTLSLLSRSPSADDPSEDLTGFCKIDISRFDKPVDISILDWLFPEGDLPPQVKTADTIRVRSISGARVVADEFARTDTTYLEPVPSKVVAARLLCGADMWSSGEAVFNGVIDSIASLSK
jgi:hypothetical protein